MDLSKLRTPARLAFGAALVLATGSAFAHPGYRHDRDDDDDGDRRDVARVLESVPHYVDVRVDVPERRCWNERAGGGDDRRAGGTLLGGLLGGVLGHNLAGGEDRGLATAAGVVVGGLIGHEVAASQDDDRGRAAYDERGGRDERYDRDRRDERYGERYAERCRVVLRPTVERRVDGYDVVYEYEGRRYRTHLAYDPGATLDVAPRWR
jgi:uncharacterized protein YcfJ